MTDAKASALPMTAHGGDIEVAWRLAACCYVRMSIMFRGEKRVEDALREMETVKVFQLLSKARGIHYSPGLDKIISPAIWRVQYYLEA